MHLFFDIGVLLWVFTCNQIIIQKWLHVMMAGSCKRSGAAASTAYYVPIIKPPLLLQHAMQGNCVLDAPVQLAKTFKLSSPSWLQAIVLHATDIDNLTWASGSLTAYNPSKSVMTCMPLSRLAIYSMDYIARGSTGCTAA